MSSMRQASRFQTQRAKFPDHEPWLDDQYIAADVKSPVMFCKKRYRVIKHLTVTQGHCLVTIQTETLSTSNVEG